MSVVDTREFSVIDLGREPLDDVLHSEDSVLKQAIQRIQADAESADPSSAVAAFQSGL